MKQRLILASITTSIGDGVPDEIVYLPEGEHKITPTVDGEPKTITVKIPREKGVSIAAALQSALDDRLKNNVRPWFDFEHKRGAASALPKAFRYEDGRGVVCALEWTGAGRDAIEGKDFSYFSPEFLLGDDGVPDGLPSRGPLGALVNEPAFRDIPRIAAANADGAQSEDLNHYQTMSKHIFAALAISASAENAETEAVTKINAMSAEIEDKKKALAKLEAEFAEMKKEKDAAVAKCQDAAKKHANSLITAAIADGRIAAKDEATQDKFRSRIEAGDSFAEEALGMLPKKHTELNKPVVNASYAGHKQAGSTLETKAQQLVAAGEAKTLSDAITLVAASEPALYEDYLKTLAK